MLQQVPMKLSLAEPKYLKDSISVISELVNETRIKFTKDGMELIAMDPANVAMVVFRLLSSAFAEYKVEDEQEVAINLNNMKQVLRRAKPSDMITLEIAENRLKLTLKGTSTRTFQLPIIDIDEKEQEVPNLKFPVTIETSSETLNEAIEDADIVAESVNFIAEPKFFKISAEGDLNSASISIPASDKTKIKMEGSEAVKAKYSVEYLKKMMQSAKLADDVSVQFNKDYPLRLTFNTIDRVLLSFILAPRVEND